MGGEKEEKGKGRSDSVLILTKLLRKYAQLELHENVIWFIGKSIWQYQQLSALCTLPHLPV